ncbi:synaptotagmin-11-like isoform X2 [Argopecten irradians]|uniref:synaptotagmin-11-like isoform X2 n=1 Tax=Argopecten irradians TaxID=31199 RepID=UPI003718C5B8
MGITVPTYEVAAIITALVSTALVLFVGLFVCWKYPFCRSRTFWDKHTKKLVRKLYSRFHREREKPDDTRSLVMGPLLRRRQSEQTKFVVPQIFVDYGSRRTSYASDYVRRCSAESGSSRRTSLASVDTDRRGSGSSISSRRTSLASDADRRGSASSVCSRRTSLLSSECPSRRGSGSSKSGISSRKSSDASRFGDTDELLADFSDSEAIEEEFLDELQKQEVRRSSLEEVSSGKTGHEKEKKKPYRRSHSLAEIRRPTHVFLPEGRGRGDSRRVTLSSLVVSSMNVLDHTVNPVGPAYHPRKKSKSRPGSIGLPDRPVVMHDLNLEEMMVPRQAPQQLPTGRLKVQFQFNANRSALTVIVIEAENLRIADMPCDSEINPYVKAFLVPGRTFKYRTKTLPKTKTPVFLEKFTISDLVPSDLSDDAAMEFQIYSSHHVSRRHLVGVASFLLKDVPKLDNGLVDLTIMPQTVFRLHQGDIRISGCYQPVAGKIVFNVLEARNLPRVSLLGAINPYVKVEMYVNGIREAKHKTKVRQNTQDPVWNHPCVFEINRENPKLLGHVFVFHVIHKDMMMGIQKIGQVELGWYSHGEQLDHWYDIMEHPHRPTDYWHPVIKTSKIMS